MAVEEAATLPGADSLTQAASKIEGLLSAKEEPTQQAQSTETEVETPQQTAEETTPTDGGEEAKAEDKADANEVKLETLEELAEATGLPLDQLLNIKARTKVDGEEKAIPLSEIVKSYQLEGHVNKKSMELAEQRKAFEADREKQSVELTNRLKEAEALSTHLEQNLLAEYNAIDWTALRNTDPAEFAARKQEYNERYAQIQGLKQRALFETQRLYQEQANKQSEEFKKIIETESARLVESIPEWKDEAKAKAGKAEIKDYLKSMGFNDQEIGSIYDHRHVKLIRNAMLYEKASKKVNIEQKKVANLPKVLKAGTQPNKGDAQREKEKEHLARLRKSGRLEDAAAIIMNRI